MGLDVVLRATAALHEPSKGAPPMLSPTVKQLIETIESLRAKGVALTA
jgi:hypothetical protein